ncbi:MAG: LemA family protein, partial [Candidatus Acidiferrales bacterium]
MKSAGAIVAVLVIIVVIIAIAFGGSYITHRNQMVTLNEDVKGKWAAVETDLQRRADLIPNLVETVKGYAAQEQTVFSDVDKARTQYMNAQTPADKIATSNALYGAEVKVLALQENYPQLKSNENFLRLQDEIAGTENRIAVSRKRYNDSIQAYNTYIGRFPGSLFAG